VERTIHSAHSMKAIGNSRINTMLLLRNSTQTLSKKKTSNDSVISKILKIKGLYKLKVILKDIPYDQHLQNFLSVRQKARHSPLLRRTTALFR